MREGDSLGKPLDLTGEVFGRLTREAVASITQEGERWKVIGGTGDLYEVSDYGRVRSRRWRGVEYPEGKELAQTAHPNGYRKVTINGRTRLVHDLVLRAFVGDPPPGFVARHLEGNPADNRLEKLAWGTRSQNNQDTARHGRVNTQKVTEDEAWGIKLLLRLGNDGPRIKDCYPTATTGIISCINRGDTWGHLTVEFRP